MRTAVRASLEEDGALDDVTTLSVVPEDLSLRAQVVVKEEGILAGLAALPVTFSEVDERVEVQLLTEDGAAASPGEPIARLSGPARAILTGERTALNLVSHLSGIATTTGALVERSGTAEVVDTRKTLPGLRALQKHAVRCGGGVNHRFGLSDAVLVKDNHIAAVGSVTEAVGRAKTSGLPVQCEVESAAELREALEAGADSLLLDNRSIAELTELVELARSMRPHIPLEASGGITVQTIEAVAATGVDRISVGALTHSAPALDISLRVC
ncbi:MAG TPA: carboxylating nicotinate-nucleotide diphosphorylase [Actinomycetota bacterium]|nr:carboxylating nicotinate-nucleotide diphosphorylase [Actinomycetota bacterium]